MNDSRDCLSTSLFSSRRRMLWPLNIRHYVQDIMTDPKRASGCDREMPKAATSGIPAALRDMPGPCGGRARGRQWTTPLPPATAIL